MRRLKIETRLRSEAQWNIPEPGMPDGDREAYPLISREMFLPKQPAITMWKPAALAAAALVLITGAGVGLFHIRPIEGFFSDSSTEWQSSALSAPAARIGDITISEKELRTEINSCVALGEQTVDLNERIYKIASYKLMREQLEGTEQELSESLEAELYAYSVERIKNESSEAVRKWQLTREEMVDVVYSMRLNEEIKSHYIQVISPRMIAENPGITDVNALLEKIDAYIDSMVRELADIQVDPQAIDRIAEYAQSKNIELIRNTTGTNHETRFYQKSGFKPLATVNGTPTFFEMGYVEAYLSLVEQNLELNWKKIEEDYQKGLLTKEEYEEKTALYQRSRQDNTYERIVEDIVKKTILEQEASRRGVSLSKAGYMEDALTYIQSFRESVKDTDLALVSFQAFLSELQMSYEEYASSYLAYAFYIQDIRESVKEDLIEEKALQNASDSEQDEAYRRYMDQLYQDARVVYTRP